MMLANLKAWTARMENKSLVLDAETNVDFLNHGVILFLFDQIVFGN